MFHEIKSQLAKLLAMEGIIVQHRAGITTAGFDIANRILYLPDWQDISEDLYDMLVVHEVGHALYTPPAGWENAIKSIGENVYNDEKKAASSIKQFLNVVEDARIDRLQKTRYPGSKRNYVAGLKELYDRNFFGIKDKDVNTYKFIDKANIYFKGGIGFGIKFSDKEKDFLRRMDTTTTFDEVSVLTEEIFRYSLSEIVPDSEKTTRVFIDGDGVSSNQDDKGKRSEKSDETGDDAGSDETEDNNKVTGKNSSDDKFAEAQRKDSPPTTGGGSNATPTKPGGKNLLPEVLTVSASEQNAKSIINQNSINYIYTKYPEIVDVHDFVDDFKKVIPEMMSAINSKHLRNNEDIIKKNHDSLSIWKQNERPITSYMVKEFEMRKAAETYSRVAVSKTGVINMNKIHSYHYNDDIFKRNTTVPLGKNHGFFMVLDWSGSMSLDLNKTMRQLFSLVLFCKRIQVPFEVYLFKSYTTAPRSCDSDYIFGGFKMRNILSSRMSPSMFADAMNVMWFASTNTVSSDMLCGTPLNQAIIVSEKLINDFRTNNRLEIVNTIFLTDGGSDPCSINYSKVMPQNNGHKNNYSLRDTKSHKVYDIGSLSGSVYTQSLIKILKDRTQTNMIGFYLYSGSFNRLKSCFSIDVDKEKLWNDNGFIGIKNAGYDEYYIIDVRRDSEEHEFESLVAGATKNKIHKAFASNNTNRKTSRKLLNNFVERISKNIF